MLPEKTFYGSRSKRSLAGLCLIILSLALFLPGSGIERSVVYVATCLLLFVIGFIQLLNAAFEYPCIELTSRGLALKSLVGTASAEWNSLAEFKTFSRYKGLLQEKDLSLRAKIIGNNISSNLEHQIFFTIGLANFFDGDASDILNDLNTYRQTALKLDQLNS